MKGLPKQGRALRLFAAAGCTLALFASLPLFNYIHETHHGELEVQEVIRAEPPPVPPPSPPRKRLEAEREKVVPTLKRVVLRPRIPLQASLGLNLDMGDIVGDFAFEFALQDRGPTVHPSDYVFELTEIDAPPRPVNRVRPVYPPHARMRRVEGAVTLEFVVGVDGTVRNAAVIRATPEKIFDEAALRAVRRWTFDPGSKAGRPVVVRVRQALAFSLEE